MKVKLNAPRSCGSTCIAASSTERSGWAAISAVTRSESVVAAKAPGTPASAALLASSAVLTRLPLWHSASPVPVSVVRKVGCAFSHVEAPGGGLLVSPGGGAGGRVAGGADGEVAAQAAQRRFVEDLADQPQVLVDDDRGPVGHGDAGRLLAAVLERVQAEVGELRDLLPRCPHAEDATGVLGSGRRGVEVVRQPSITARHISTVPASPTVPAACEVTVTTVATCPCRSVHVR